MTCVPANTKEDAILYEMIVYLPMAGWCIDHFEIPANWCKDQTQMSVYKIESQEVN